MLLQGVSTNVRRDRAKKILDEVGLEGMYDRRPAELSGGQQQRVAVARAIVSDPSIVLADEPTANLDSVTGMGLLEIMKQMNEKKKTLTQANFFVEGGGEYLTSLKLMPGTYFLVVEAGPGIVPHSEPYTVSVSGVPEVAPAEVKVALRQALDFLVSQQKDDGSFPGRRGDGAGITGLAIQALMGAECLERNDWEAIYRGVDYLASCSYLLSYRI